MTARGPSQNERSLGVPARRCVSLSDGIANRPSASFRRRRAVFRSGGACNRPSGVISTPEGASRTESRREPMLRRDSDAGGPSLARIPPHSRFRRHILAGGRIFAAAAACNRAPGVTSTPGARLSTVVPAKTPRYAFLRREVLRPAELRPAAVLRPVAAPRPEEPFRAPRAPRAPAAAFFSLLGQSMFTQMRHGPRCVTTSTMGAPHSGQVSPVA